MSVHDADSVFQCLFEQSADAIWLHEVRGDSVVLLDCNRAAVELAGAETKQQLVGTRFEELSPRFQADGSMAAEKTAEVVALVRRHRSHRFQWRLRRLDGRIIPIEVSVTSVVIRGKPVFVGMVRDISERAEAALAESEARFSAAFHASPAFISIIRLVDGQYVLANDKFLNFLGYPLEQIVGRACTDLGIWEDPAEFTSVFHDIRTLNSIRNRECRWRNRRGEVFTVLFSAETIKLNDTPHVLAMALDISQRKRAEEELKASEVRLRESETRFSVAFQASPVFISIFRKSTEKYVLANDALLHWLGCSRQEVLGRTSGELGMWENHDERVAVWRDLRSTGSIRQRECRWRNRRGDLATILLSAETITLDNEPHVLSLVLDITQRKKAEVEMLKALTREKELSQLKSNFVSMVSHEFRTPLGIIQSSTELLRDFHQKMSPDERHDQLESITRNTRRMAGMMEEVLVLSRLDVGKLIFQPALVDLNVFFRRIVDEVLSATNYRCFIDLCLNSVPAESQADERLLGHIFTNLLSNAVKYSESGATVEFSITPDCGDAVCVVRDRGIGISEADQRHLFQAFHRGANVGSRAGTGLGLLLVKRCADLHGAEVQVQSRIGEGTTVIVKLPVFEQKS